MIDREDWLQRWGCVIAISISLFMWAGIIGAIVMLVRRWLV